MSKSKFKVLVKLFSDLIWDIDRMSSSGQETLKKIADLIDGEVRANESK